MIRRLPARGSRSPGISPKAWKWRLILTALLLTWAAGCGDSDPQFVVVPVGPTPVALEGTVQFTSTRGGTIWTVIGGPVNGTIDPFGLYTAPSALPPDPMVTILAQKGNDDTFAFVQLTP